MKKIILAALMAAAITSCKDSGAKALILYYSQTGADICRFDVEQAYSGTYEQTIARCLHNCDICGKCSFLKGNSKTRRCSY